MIWRLNLRLIQVSACISRYMNISEMRSGKGSFKEMRSFPQRVLWQNICRLPGVRWILHTVSFWRKDTLCRSPAGDILCPEWKSFLIFPAGKKCRRLRVRKLLPMLFRSSLAAKRQKKRILQCSMIFRPMESA